MENKNDNRLAALGFSLSGSISGLRFKKILERFPDAKTAFFSNRENLRYAGLRNEAITKLFSFRKEFKADPLINQMDKQGISFVCLFEDNYPLLLKEVDDPPIILYYRGRLPSWNNNYLAVVGSRLHSPYGKRVIEEILPPLSRCGISIISGLALGIDTLAHEEALRSGGNTCAVLGSGVDDNSIYPPVNRLLANKIIAQGGIVLSEYPPGTTPSRFNFPERNRIISGMSEMILVVEANIKSGALITARLGLDQNRDIGAVPGNIFSQYSKGSNKLISKGARMIMSAEDVLDCFNINCDKNESIPNNICLGHDEEENLILETIKVLSQDGGTATSDEISQLSQLDSTLINSKLSILEIAGTITKCGSGYIFS